MNINKPKWFSDLFKRHETTNDSESPSNIVLKSREAFAKQIADTIRRNTSQNTNSKKESFILGISGKWGEGKTTLLDDLRNKLEPEYKVIDINPWGVGTDQVTFLRNFLKELNNQVKPHSFIKKWFYNSKTQKLLNKMEFDVSAVKINKTFAFLYILLIGIGVVAYASFSTYLPFLPSKDDKTFIGRLIGEGIIFFSLVSPLFLLIFNNIFTTQNSSKAVATIDGVKTLLEEILNSIKRQKIVVFVDDLDRVTPEMARTLLDNLRVFFDNPQLSFVVTGDHSVLERYLGLQILTPNNSDQEQIEEGRRYLKKIFNVYWRIPAVIKPELEAFINAQITKRQTELDEVFDAAKIRILKTYLESYFEKNFRQIIRFLDTILFTFSIIKTQVEGTQGEEKSYFQEMLDEPLLVVRILMIQELCSPLFEKVLQDNTVLYNIEDAVDKEDLGKVSTLLQSITMTPAQRIFIDNFVLEKPRFFEENVLRVTSLSQFLSLAADSSFGDARGISPEDFISKIQKGDTNQIKNSIIGSGKDKIEKAAAAFNKLFTDAPATDIAQKNTYLQTLLPALTIIPQDHVSQAIFLESISHLSLSYLDGQGPNRVGIYKIFWKWLDIQKSDIGQVGTYVNMFPFQNINDFTDSIPENANWFSTKILCTWLQTYYSQDRVNALIKMNEILPQLPLEFVTKEMDSISEELVSNIIAEGNIPNRDNLTNLVTTYTETGKTKLQSRLLIEANRLNSDIWSWVETKPDLVERIALEEQVVEALNAVAPSQILIDAIRFAGVGRVNNLQDKFWEKVIEKHITNFIESVSTMMGDSVSTSFAPVSKFAIKLFKALLAEALQSSDEGKRSNILDYLNKTKWIWHNVREIPEVNKIRKWYEDESNPTIKEKLRQLLVSWGESVA